MNGRDIYEALLDFIIVPRGLGKAEGVSENKVNQQRTPKKKLYFRQMASIISQN